MALVDCHGAWRHLEATLGSVLGGILKDPHFSLGLSDAQIGLGATIYLIGQVILIFRGWVPESPRWLVTHGRAAEAEKTVEDVEKMVSGDPANLPPPEGSKQRIYLRDRYFAGHHRLSFLDRRLDRLNPDRRLVGNFLYRFSRRKLSLFSGERNFSVRNSGFGNRYFFMPAALWPAL